MSGSDTPNPLDVLAAEQPRTTFVLHGWTRADGTPGGEYVVGRHSFRAALAELEANPASDGGPYMVEDVIVTGTATVRVQLVAVVETLRALGLVADD